MKEPWFWNEEGLAAGAMRMALAPLSLAYDAAQQARAAITNAKSVGKPLLCVGAATIGGAGKTPFALALRALLEARGVNAHFASRGFGGAERGPARVGVKDSAAEVGDEALLLATSAPTFIAKDRLAGARAAAKDADAVILDDGFQNPTMVKDFSFLLIAGGEAAQRVFPAGRLREPLARAINRADALVIIDGADAPACDKPLWRASTRVETSLAAGHVIAFTGIARPERFFASLERQGFTLADKIAFGDHHFFSAADLATLEAKSKKAGVRLITTQKDHVRLPAEARARIAFTRLVMEIEDRPALASLIARKTGLAL